MFKGNRSYLCAPARPRRRDRRAGAGGAAHRGAAARRGGAEPVNREVDLVTKQAQYAEAGLAWYWLVDPDPPQGAVMGTVFAHVDAAVGYGALTVGQPFPVRLRPSDLVR